MHGKSAASKRFQSATAAVQGRGVSNKWQKAQKLAPLSQKVTPSIKTLVPELLESAGPKITVAARRSIFTHARAYLSNQHRTAEPVKMLLVKSVVAGTRVHNKQDLAVTSLKENVVEKQEERRRIQLEQEAQEAQEEEQAYHDGASTLANTGCLFDQVIKLERLAQLCKEDSVLIQKAVSSAQKCVRLLEDLKMATHEDDELLRVVQEAEPAQISSRLLQDLQSEIAAMREILNLAQEAAQEASPRNTEVLDLVGNICEEISRHHLSSIEVSSTEVPGTEVPGTEVPGPVSANVLRSGSSFVLRSGSTKDLASCEVVTSEKIAEEQLEDQAEDTDVALLPELAPREDAEEAPTEPMPGADVPSLAETAGADEPIDLEAESARLAERKRFGEEMELRDGLIDEGDEGPAEIEGDEGEKPMKEHEVADDREDVSEIDPDPRSECSPFFPPDPTDELSELFELALAAPALAALVPEPPQEERSPDRYKRTVQREPQRRVIAVPSIRLPALFSRNRKNTEDLDWNMESLNDAELDLLCAVIEEDGGNGHGVHDPEKERLWKSVFGFDGSPTKTRSPRLPRLEEKSKGEDETEVLRARSKPLSELLDLGSCSPRRKAKTLDLPRSLQGTPRHRRVS